MNGTSLLRKIGDNTPMSALGKAQSRRVDRDVIGFHSKFKRSVHQTGRNWYISLTVLKAGEVELLVSICHILDRCLHEYSGGGKSHSPVTIAAEEDRSVSERLACYDVEEQIHLSLRFIDDTVSNTARVTNPPGDLVARFDYDCDPVIDWSHQISVDLGFPVLDHADARNLNIADNFKSIR